MSTHNSENFSESENHRIAVSPAEAARIIGIGRTKLYELLDSGALRSSRIGNRRVITVQAIRECLAAHEVRHG